MPTLQGALANAPSRATATWKANQLANCPDVPRLTAFVGYLGGTLDDKPPGEDSKWQLLYLDVRLQTWLLVREDTIVHRDIVRDDNSPNSEIDVIWLKADASVSMGMSPPQQGEVQARFLRGEFTRAADFSSPLSQASLSDATGVFCQAISPGCCGPMTHPHHGGGH